MAKDTRNRKLWSLRGLLLQIHEDLIKIHRATYCIDYFQEDGLSYLERLVITLEDRKFFSHNGIHWKAVVRELFRFITFRKVRGASTIDMQLVRTVIRRRERTLKRKVYEALLANIIQYRYPKLTILRTYMSVAYLGWKVAGFRELSYQEVGVHHTDLCLQDAAKMASYLVFPKPKNPTIEWETKILRRSNYIYSIYISRKDYLDKIERRIF